MRGFWFIGVLIIILIGIMIAYIRLVLALSENRPVYDALPGSASIVFEFRNPNNAFSKFKDASFGPQLGKAPFYSKLMNQLAAMDTLLKSGISDSNFNSWENSILLASLSITGRNEFDYLYVLKKNRFDKERFSGMINSVGTATVNKRTFRDETIYEIQSISSGKSLACSFVNGLWIASYSPFLVEEAIAHLRDEKSILTNKGFKEVNELASEDADAIIYFNFGNLAAYLPMLVNEEQGDFFRSIAQFGKWMELDVKIKNNSFIINGYTSMGGEKTFLAQFGTEPTSQVEITRVMPYNTALFFYHAVDDFHEYMTQRGEMLSPEMDNFRNWMSNEWCFGVLEPLDQNFQDDAFIVVKTIDPDIAIQSLAERARLFGDDLDLEEFKAYPIGQLSVKDDLNKLFDHHFLKISYPYYTVMDNYVVFANNISVIKTMLGNYEDNQTLANDPDYMMFERNLTTTSNFYVYFNTARSVEILNAMLSNALVADIRRGNKDFVKFSPVALQFNHYEDIFFTNGYISFSSQLEEYKNTLWQVKLDAPAIITPAFVTNHYTGEKEILAQDSLHNIYLVTKAGKILWKRKLDGPIVSEIYLIDFYENTKLQYAFNTRTKIYFIDRKGEDVASYPIKLPAEATNGMLLVDYDNKKDYRVFVACSNGNIYGYYKSGKPLPGWSPQKNVGSVKFPLKYVFVDGKDYLIVMNDNAEMFFFNRRGDRRVKPIKLEKKLETDFEMRVSNNNFQLLNADKEANLYKVYRNGSFSAQKQDIPVRFFDFIYEDFNGDGNYEMVFVDSLVAKVLDERLKEIASPSFPNKIDEAFVVMQKGKKNVGFLSRSANQIYYLDSTYAIYPGFPLTANTPFIAADLFETGRNVIIAGDEKGNLNAYQVK